MSVYALMYGSLSPGIVLATSAALLIGCAAFRPQSDSSLHPGRFVARAHEIAAADWVGRYAGTGDVLSAATGEWESVPRIVLRIEQTEPGRISVAGTVADTAAWNLNISVEAAPPGVLSGRYQDGPEKPWFTYSFSLTGPRITGVVQRYPLGAEPLPETAMDEWMIDVQRRPSGP